MSTQYHGTIAVNVHAPMLLSNMLFPYLLSLVMTSYFCETGVPPDQQYNNNIISFTLTIHFGMVKTVVQLAHTACSTVHHGFVDNYLSELK